MLNLLGPVFESCTYSTVQVTVISSLHLFQLSEAVFRVFSASIIIFVANMSWEIVGSSSAEMFSISKGKLYSSICRLFSELHVLPSE